MAASLPDLESPFLSGELELGEHESQATGGGISVIDERGAPLVDGEYLFHQGALTVRGQFNSFGLAQLGKIDPKQPFLFEVRDRVCAIRQGAYFDPDDPAIEYGGSWFDWTLVRDDKAPHQSFWPHYQAAMSAKYLPYGVDRFLQHEHITRRPIRLHKTFFNNTAGAKIRATPVEVRVGPLVRYTSDRCAVIWLEALTPSLVRVRFKKGAGNESSRYASTVRVGGRYFASVELDGLEPGQLYDYTVDLTPLPAKDPVPVEAADIAAAFPKLGAVVEAAQQEQIRALARSNRKWLCFRTLLPKYERLTFATGSCRWYPADDKQGEDAGRDMMHELGKWVAGATPETWPSFLFLSGDQIYADECADDHARRLVEARFAARVPGPIEKPNVALAERLVDGAWAGRFAHRFKGYKPPAANFVEMIKKGLDKLDELRKNHPDIWKIAEEYPGSNPSDKLKWRYNTLKNRRELGGAHTEADDERKAREAVAHLDQAKTYEVGSEPFRAIEMHWAAQTGTPLRKQTPAKNLPPGGFDPALRKNPMRRGFLTYNFLLWKLPAFERDLPQLKYTEGPLVLRTSEARGYPSADGGVHAADFAEYASHYERAWTSSREVRLLLAHLPSFMIFDDHELTDDWNFDVTWARMLHNPKDDYRMWPKTLTDAMSAYFVYQGFGNKAPSQWNPRDPRVLALKEAQRQGKDALPALRRCIYDACFAPRYTTTERHAAGTSLDWHYRLPFEPPFLVPDCRSRKILVASDDEQRVVDHDSKHAPKSRTLDPAQLDWIRRELAKSPRAEVAFLGTSTPLLLQSKAMAFMLKPELAASSAVRGTDVAGMLALVTESTKFGIGSNDLLRVFRRSNDLEHIIRDHTWVDLWELVEGLRAAKSPLKTLVLVSGDVHHNYCMTAASRGSGRPKPEFLQITSSGFRTTKRGHFKEWLAEKLGNIPFDIGKRTMFPAFMKLAGEVFPDMVLFQNAVAFVELSLGKEVDVRVEFLSNSDRYKYKYTSGPAYMLRGQSAVLSEVAAVNQAELL